MDESLAKIRHERSKKDFPTLKLEDDEYVEFAFKRARICLLAIFAGVAASLIIILLAFLLVLLGQSMLDEMGRNFVFIILFTLLASAIIIGVIAIMIYNGNRLFITNRRVTQMIMNSPVSRSINAIDLTSVEDISFHQNGLLQNFLHYGTLRLATVGDETTYTFKYSDISPEDLKAITKLISNAKKKCKDKLV
ncbi:PH domain-containing protein [Candidatus Saccharibacteria bacterium]|nr:PH domain-containing protein [Candidatus Saccharibacteria bacterium]